MLLINDINQQLTRDCTYMGTLFICCVQTCTFVVLSTLGSIFENCAECFATLVARLFLVQPPNIA